MENKQRIEWVRYYTLIWSNLFFDGLWWLTLIRKTAGIQERSKESVDGRPWCWQYVASSPDAAYHHECSLFPNKILFHIPIIHLDDRPVDQDRIVANNTAQDAEHDHSWEERWKHVFLRRSHLSSLCLSLLQRTRLQTDVITNEIVA